MIVVEGTMAEKENNCVCLNLSLIQHLCANKNGVTKQKRCNKCFVICGVRDEIAVGISYSWIVI